MHTGMISVNFSSPHNTQKENHSRHKFRCFDTGDAGPVHFGNFPNILIHIFDNKLGFFFFLLLIIIFYLD